MNKTIKKKLFLFLNIFILLSLFSYFIYLEVVITVPEIKKLEKLKFKETSIIYDKKWNELYKIYQENRTYVNLKDINKNMINAIVAWEDQRFWKNPWFDSIWITRAIIKWAWNNFRFSWTSWITQQLARIVFLSKERTINRKLKELYLAIKLTNRYTKEKILELYLNKVFFWWNSYWIEQASKTFFWVPAKDLNVLQSSILASLPKAPSELSPYSFKWNLLWYPIIEEKNTKTITKILDKSTIKKYSKELKQLSSSINKIKFKKINGKLELCNIDKELQVLNFTKDKKGCYLIKYNKLLSFLNSIYIEDDKMLLSYNTWRKDYILYRMLEDEHINEKDYKKAFLSSFWFEFKKYKDKIKYPYFVMYVKTFLAKEYWEDFISKWWLRIYTTIDPKLQTKAEALIREQVKINTKKYNARNSALISVDAKTWEILSMVWWVNYFDKENKGYNNILLARLQPWSIFKPLLYTLAMIKKRFRSKSIVYDVPTVFPWWYTPRNSDWTFLWKITLDKSLNYSRNIPAIKMYYEVWWEKPIIDFIDKLWIKSVKRFKEYYKEKYKKEYKYLAPMALWTTELTTMELIWAYQIFANFWIKQEIKPILKIYDSSWKLIKDYTVNNKWEKILSKIIAYKINSILSNTKTRPKTRNQFLALDNKKQMAAKTWTSTKRVKWILRPVNLWTLWYTPQIVTIVWSWNTSWKTLTWNAYWLTASWPTLKKFMEYAHKNLKIEKWWFPK